MLRIASAAILMTWAEPAPIASAAALPASTMTMRWKDPSGLPASPAAGAPLCQRAAVRKVDMDGAALVHDLTQEPPADAVAAVLYTEGGCARPIVVSRGIGSQPNGK